MIIIIGIIIIVISSIIISAEIGRPYVHASSRGLPLLRPRARAGPTNANTTSNDMVYNNQYELHN